MAELPAANNPYPDLWNHQDAKKKKPESKKDGNRLCIRLLNSD